MAELEIIDVEIVPQHTLPAAIKQQTKDSYYPACSLAEREAALRLLAPSTHEVVLGAGWIDYDDPSSSEGSSDNESSSSYSTLSTPPPITPPSSGLTDALLVRSCSQGWSLSFELHPTHHIPTPLSSTEVLISNTAVGLNPVDWKSVSYNFGIPAFPWILGRDIAGTIVQVPEDNDEGWQVGDRVWTCADSREMRAGGYQRYSVHDKRTLARVPQGVGDDEAATLGTGLITAAVALFAFFKLPLAKVGQNSIEERFEKVSIEEEKGEADWILIYGGGAVTGIFAAQLAHISSLRVISIASPSNFSYLTSLGVDVCIDRHQPPSAILSSITSTLRQRGGKLRYAMDCISSNTASLCLQALEENGGASSEMICLAGNPKSQGSGQVKVHKISFSTTFYHPDGHFAKDILSYLTQLLEEASLKPCRPEVLPDGLAGIRLGLELLREGKAPRAKKLVVRVKDTPAADVTHLGVRTELGWNGV